MARGVRNGSVIHVYDNQFMMLVDGGKVVDYTAEPGYYKVDNSSLPSMLNGELGESVKETFNRIKYGGQTPTAQKVYFLNLQEIKGIKFGTRNPINYFDNFYNAELFLRAHGNYSIKITNPLQFYAEVIPRNKDRVNYDEIGEQYLSEFLEALQSAINQMSADGTRISYVTSKAMELGKYMQDILDADWNQMRGMEIQKVGIAGISYDEESQKLINMRNEGAMLGSDFNVMRGMAVKNITEGVRDAGSNANGAMAGFMGVGMGMNAMNQTLSGLGAMQTPADMQANAGMQQGGAAQAGESSWEAVRREVREETGLDVSKADGGYLFTYRRINPDEGDNYFVDVYRFVMDVKDEDLHLQEEETDGYRFAALDEIKGYAAEGKFLHYDSIRQAFEL